MRVAIQIPVECICRAGVHAVYSGDRSSSSGRKKKRKKDELQNEFFLKQSFVSEALQNMTG